ncbi:hypothetical protein BJ878DRAFT_66515 [Calycina marina]|uniref:2EXR domain-containing protein n=1 Tax=Calycina marina TaxID=1763456 RepID=A0A9P7Z3A4_9HELO|nr:hypothetical protein BJ878DRAFT_66515 [Calycina marina]
MLTMTHNQEQPFYLAKLPTEVRLMIWEEAARAAIRVSVQPCIDTAWIFEDWRPWSLSPPANFMFAIRKFSPDDVQRARLSQVNQESRAVVQEVISHDPSEDTGAQRESLPFSLSYERDIFCIECSEARGFDEGVFVGHNSIADELCYYQIIDRQEFLDNAEQICFTWFYETRLPPYIDIIVTSFILPVVAQFKKLRTVFIVMDERPLITDGMVEGKTVEAVYPTSSDPNSYYQMVKRGREELKECLEDKGMDVDLMFQKRVVVVDQSIEKARDSSSGSSDGQPT